MSGIAGIIHFDGKPVEPGLIEKMTAAMAHRGPDGIHHWTKGNVALGQCMLRTTPESLEEHQPLPNEDETLVLVMDGRVDNWEELRRELLGRGARLRSRSDGELVLRAYEVWGDDCLPRIDGDFALVIWDSRRRTAFCARDRIGRRPLYYSRHGSCLAFASEFSSLLDVSWVSDAINDNCVIEHLAGSGSSSLTETLVQGVLRLPPASRLLTSQDGLVERRYWDIDCLSTLHYRDDREYEDHFRETLRSSIKCRLRSLAPVGVLLSGGLDSSAVLCMASALRDRPELRSYSAVFPGSPCDESTYIDAVNAHARVRGQAVPNNPPPATYYIEQINRTKDLCDSPNGTPLNALRCTAREAGVGVVLTGHGADEWFGRNPYYYDELLRTGSYGTLLGQCLYDLRMAKAPASVVREVAAPAIRRFAPKPVVRAAKETLARLRRRDAAATVVVPAAGYRAAPLERLQSSGRCRRLEHLAHCRLHSLVNLGESVRAIELEDRAASRAGVEERTPFEDRRVVEFGFSIPERLRSKAAGKYILRTALRGVLPESVRMRTEKAEFSSLLAQVLLDPMVAGSLACRRLADRGLVDRLAVAAKYKEFKSLYEDGSDGYVKHVWQLWMAFALETWVGMMENR